MCKACAVMVVGTCISVFDTPLTCNSQPSLHRYVHLGPKVRSNMLECALSGDSLNNVFVLLHGLFACPLLIVKGRRRQFLPVKVCLTPFRCISTLRFFCAPSEESAQNDHSMVVQALMDNKAALGVMLKVPRYRHACVHYNILNMCVGLLSSSTPESCHVW